MAIENDLTRIAVALEGILAHLKARPVMPELRLTATPAEEPKSADNNQALAVEEPPKKKRGRPSKAELEMKAAVAARTDVPPATVAPGPEMTSVYLDEVGPAPTSLPVEQPKPAEQIPAPALTIEKVRSEAIAFVQSKGDAGREALVAVLAKFSAKSISELPEPKWPEFVAQMKAA